MADENLTLTQDITENDYPMQHAGEEIDEILSRAGKIHYGTVEHKLTGANALMRIPLGLTFAPKQVIGRQAHQHHTRRSVLTLMVRESRTI